MQKTCKIFFYIFIIRCLFQPNLFAQSIDTLFMSDENKHFLLIESIPPASTVILDSVFVGKTPIIIPINDIKHHQVIVQHSGFVPFNCEVAADFQDTLSINTILERYSGSISVFSDNDKSIIKINGRKYGSGRIDSLNLEFGTYDLSVYNPSYQRDVSTEINIEKLKNLTFKAEYNIVSVPRLLASIILPGYAQFDDKKYIKGIGFSMAALGSVAFMISKYFQYSSAEDDYNIALHNYDFATDENTAILARNEAERKQDEYQIDKKNFEISLAVVAFIWVGNAIDVVLNHLLSDRIDAFAYEVPLNTRHSTISNYWLSLNYRIE
jgi:hypothetical protein